MNTFTPLAARHPPLAARRAFTLVELLVVIVVIGILASLVMGAVQVARETARAAKTRATIAKLHNVIMGMYESYHTRRVPINTSAMSTTDQAAMRDPHIAAMVRLYLLRDLMRMEMPERYTDLNNGLNAFPIPWTSPTGDSLSQKVLLPSVPALYQAYLNRLNGTKLQGDDSAELLYMIVTIGCRARGQFSENEIANDPVDGFPYFVDGWGHPIRFLRWAPGFIDSDIQANVAAPSGSGYAINSSLAQTASLTDHDPFDPMQVDTNNGAGGGPSGWRLVPLIYSAGRDGQYGIGRDNGNGTSYVWNNNTYQQVWGSPDGTTYRLDNIHNHRLQGDSK
jgi:prepilin-type N-terminal cleavage/methylation domain-containing protein